MPSSRRYARRTLPVAKQSSAPPVVSKSSKKWLIAPAIFTLIIVLIALSKYSPANSAPAERLSGSASSVAVSDASLITPPLPLITPADMPAPDTVKDNLPASVPAQMSEQGATMRRVVSKKIENGMVTLTLKDEATGRLSIMKQPLGTNINIVNKSSAVTVAAASVDVSRANLPTQGIEKIKAGMTVPTRNPVTGKTEFKKVTRTFKHTAYEIVKLELADSKTGRIADSLRGTPEHPFFTPKGIVAMGDLKPQMKVDTRRGPPLVVKSVMREAHPEGIPVYNFEVEGDHTYFVGKAEGGVWVHNTCPTVQELENAYNAATKSYKGGPLSEAGRALAKHNPVSRPGSAFPIPRGGPAAVNDLAHDVVGDILRNPRSVRIDRGAVFDIVAPDGRGIRFFTNGAFKGFLEP